MRQQHLYLCLTGLGISLCLICLLLIPIHVETIAQGVTPTPCRPMPLHCPADAYPAVLGSQPSAEEVATTFHQQAISHTIPVTLLMSIGQQESNWDQFEAEAGEAGCTVMPAANISCDYGLMQINWIHHNTYDFSQVAADYVYNIATGASILNWQWGYRPQANFGNRTHLIDWYTPLWGYNGWTDDNNPHDALAGRVWGEANPNLFPYQEKILYSLWERPAIDGEARWTISQTLILPDDELFEIGSTPNRDILIFNPQPHPPLFAPNCGIEQTTISYTLETTQPVTTQLTIRNQPPRSDDINLIKTLPVGVNVWDGTDEAGQPVPEGKYWFTVAVSNTHNQLIGRQSNPVQVVCHPLYLPTFLKNYPPVYFSETFNPIHPAWIFYNNDPDNEVDDYVFVYHNGGYDDNQSLFLTEQGDLYSFTSGAIISLQIPPPNGEVILSFWVRRFGNHGAYRVLVDNEIVVSEQSTAANWHQHRVVVTAAAADGDLVLHFQVPSQFLHQAILFDTIQVIGD